VFTSGGKRKLTRYQALGVPEVWFWEDGVFGLYHLRSHAYEKIDQSEVRPGLDINLLSRCLLMASRVEAVKKFGAGCLGFRVQVAWAIAPLFINILLGYNTHLYILSFAGADAASILY
jgi:hypothetical protein